MKLALIAFLVSFQAQALTYVYDVMYDDEKQGIQVEIKLDGKFEKSSKVISLKVTALEPQVTLFYLNEKEVQANFNISWINNKTLFIQNNDKFTVKSSVQKSFYNGYMDAPIQRGHEYVIGGDFDNGFNLTAKGNLEGERFEVSNYSQGEMAIFGELLFNSIK